MIKFLLAILVCTSATDCHWQRIRAFSNQDKCYQVGRAYRADPRVLRFRCVVLFEEWG